ncbi:MAG: hypothetical protein ACRCX2_01670 [Paraclostridium sp.]
MEFLQYLKKRKKWLEFLSGQKEVIKSIRETDDENLFLSDGTKQIYQINVVYNKKMILKITFLPYLKEGKQFRVEHKRRSEDLYEAIKHIHHTKNRHYHIMYTYSFIEALNAAFDYIHYSKTLSNINFDELKFVFKK